MPIGLGKKRLMKSTWWPQPHEDRYQIAFELDSTAIDNTIFPIVMYDEGKGAPADLETHPENASFAKTDSPNCFPGSRVDNVFCKIQFALTSKALDENLPAIRVAFMVVMNSFEDIDVTDPLSSNTVGTVLRLQDEATDNQAFPLWNGTKMAEGSASVSIIGALVPGLTTNQKLEGVGFNPNTFYDTIHFETIADKVKSNVGGLKWLTLTKRNPVINIPIFIPGKVKRMNRNSFLGVMVQAPAVDSILQTVHTRDITAATQYVDCTCWFRYNEWHEKFYNGAT